MLSRGKMEYFSKWILTEEETPPADPNLAGDSNKLPPSTGGGLGGGLGGGGLGGGLGSDIGGGLGGGLGGGGDTQGEKPIELMPIKIDDAWGALKKAVRDMKDYTKLDIYHNLKINKKQEIKSKSLKSFG